MMSNKYVCSRNEEILYMYRYNFISKRKVDEIRFERDGDEERNRYTSKMLTRAKSATNPVARPGNNIPTCLELEKKDYSSLLASILLI